MNKLIIVFAIWFSILYQSALYCMDQVSPRYSLAYIIQPKNADDMVTFVKIIPNNHLIIFDRKGRGELWHLAATPTSIKSFASLDIFSLENAFTYQDEDGHLLFIGFDNWRNEIFVYNLAQPNQCKITKNESDEQIEQSGLLTDKINFTDEPWFNKKNLYVGHSFQLFQQTAGTLIMNNTRDGTFFEIYPRWLDAEKQYQSNNDVLFKSVPIVVPNIRVRNEGKIVSAHTFQKERNKWRLPDEIFDTESLTNEEKRELNWHSFQIPTESSLTTREWFENVTCYHSTINGVLCCGHDEFVSIWQQKK